MTMGDYTEAHKSFDPEAFANQIKANGVGRTTHYEQRLKYNAAKRRFDGPPVARVTAKPPVASYEKDGRRYTMRQLEHFGDAIFTLVSRLECYELFSQKQRSYFFWSEKFGSDANMHRRSTQLETQIGQEYVDNGLEAAMGMAKEILIHTPAYQSAEEHSKSPNCK